MKKINRREFGKRAGIVGVATVVSSHFSGLFFPEKAGAASTKEMSKKDVTFVKVGFTNCFLLPCDGGYLQMDVSYPNDYRQYLSGLKKLGIKTSDIKYLLLTHHHDDHAGFSAQLLDDSGAVLVVHEKALEHLARGVSEDTSRPINGRIKVLMGIVGLIHEFRFPPVVPREGDYIVTGDDSKFLKSIGIEGEIIHTPGHTDDSISVVLDNGRAFVGDAAMNFLHACNNTPRPIYVTDMDEVYESWVRLKKHGAREIYPAHGDLLHIDDLSPV
jgi:glyoxylase-like metal-dependent hydrolase (beta-lactamase superfamily II)